MLDSLLARRRRVDALLADVVLPYLHELGERWERGEASVAQEHFASASSAAACSVSRVAGAAASARCALLACLPGEQHDLGLIAFGLALRARGWRIAYLGGDTPLESARAPRTLVDPRSSS